MRILTASMTGAWDDQSVLPVLVELGVERDLQWAYTCGRVPTCCGARTVYGGW